MPGRNLVAIHMKLDRDAQAGLVEVSMIGKSSSETSALARPTPEQQAFMDMELGAFLHYDLNVFTGQEHGDVLKPASKFNSTALNVEKWVRTAKAMGAKYAVLTARHEGGFCLWPTDTTGYSIKNGPYKNGQGDIVREFVDACRKCGIKPGFHHSAMFDRRGVGQVHHRVRDVLDRRGPTHRRQALHHVLRSLPVERRVDDARRDGVHPDAVFRVLHCQVLGDRLQIAGLLHQHVLDGELGDIEEALDIRRDERLEVLGSVVRERLGEEDAGVIDQCVD